MCMGSNTRSVGGRTENVEHKLLKRKRRNERERERERERGEGERERERERERSPKLRQK